MSSDAAAQVALSGELGEFLIELSKALQRSGMYPPGHPALEHAASLLMVRLEALLEVRPVLTVGVARRQLVVAGVATDARNPVLRSLADRLHRHHIGAITIRRGADAVQVLEVLHLLAREPERGEPGLGLKDPAKLESWAHVQLHALTYDELQLTEDDRSREEEDGDAARLWLGLARAALATQSAGAVEADPGVVAQAINTKGGEQAYDEVIVGYLLQIAQQLRAGEAPGADALRRRMAGVVAGLDDPTRARLLTMGGDLGQRLDFLEDAADGFSAGAVLELVKSAALTSHQTVSDSMLRLLTKLATHADPDGGEQPAAADTALREQVRALIADWRLADPNPQAYTSALRSLTGRRAAGAEPATDSQQDARRILQMAIEADVTGPQVWRACDALLDAGDVAGLTLPLRPTPSGRAAERALLAWLQDATRLQRMISVERPDLDALDPLITRTPAEVTTSPLLDALAESSHRSVRMGLFRRLASLGPAIVPHVLARAHDPRWYVQRNMLALLNEVGEVPVGFSPLSHARHERSVVRYEAIRLLLSRTGDRERGLCMALADADERVFRLALLPYDGPVPDAAVALIGQRLASGAAADDSRVRLVALAARAGTASELQLLLRCVVSGRTFFGMTRLAPKSPEMLTALRALAARWSADPHAGRVLKRAAKSRDPEIAAAAGGQT